MSEATNLVFWLSAIFINYILILNYGKLPFTFEGNIRRFIGAFLMYGILSQGFLVSGATLQADDINLISFTFSLMGLIYFLIQMAMVVTNLLDEKHYLGK